jgi:diadenylate cyclase
VGDRCCRYNVDGPLPPQRREYALSYQFLNELVHRIESYPPHAVIVELAVLWVVVYLFMRILRGTRGARVIMGVALILLVATPIVRVLTSDNEYERLNYLYNRFVTIAMITLVVVFQPELRRALVRLGDAPFFRGAGLRHARVVEAVIDAVLSLGKAKTGAIIALERDIVLEGVVDAGTPLDALVSSELLTTIFKPGSALHDMAVVIREDRIVAAGVQLPLAEGVTFSTELGSRHRAAVGLTQETDAVVIVVSEETGVVSVARRGELIRHLGAEDLRNILTKGEAPRKKRRPGSPRKSLAA